MMVSVSVDDGVANQDDGMAASLPSIYMRFGRLAHCNLATVTLVCWVGAA